MKEKLVGEFSKPDEDDSSGKVKLVGEYTNFPKDINAYLSQYYRKQRLKKPPGSLARFVSRVASATDDSLGTSRSNRYGKLILLGFVIGIAAGTCLGISTADTPIIPIDPKHTLLGVKLAYILLIICISSVIGVLFGCALSEVIWGAPWYNRAWLASTPAIPPFLLPKVTGIKNAALRTIMGFFYGAGIGFVIWLFSYYRMTMWDHPSPEMLWIALGLLVAGCGGYFGYVFYKTQK